jgi:hypothetical protein
MPVNANVWPGPFPCPPPDTCMRCLVCGETKPWGIFDGGTGAAVCGDCRDAGRKAAAEKGG